MNTDALKLLDYPTESEDQPFMELLDAIGRSADRAKRLAKDALKFRTNLVAEKKATALNELIRNTLAELDSTSKNRGIRLETRLAHQLELEVAVPIDAVFIAQVLINLVFNAFDASEEGQRVVVSSALESREVRITVTDFGKGIDPADQLTLFEPFFTRREFGIGLGLFISKVIVEDLHQGHIEVLSGKKQTHFIVHLPLIAVNP